jgi:hypothetical protein
MNTSHSFLLLKCKNIDKYETGSTKIYKVDFTEDYSSRYQALKKYASLKINLMRNKSKRKPGSEPMRIG